MDLTFGNGRWERRRRNAVDCRVYFFWHDKYMCKSVQKSSEKKVFQLKMDTMTFQNGMKKNSLGHFASILLSLSGTTYVRTRPIDARFHSSQNWQVWSVVMRRKPALARVLYYYIYVLLLSPWSRAGTQRQKNSQILSQWEINVLIKCYQMSLILNFSGVGPRR